MTKALIVDDSSESRYLLGRILKKAFDVRIIEAEDGKVALEKIQKDLPDIMFLDYEMPNLDGIETIKAIRAERDYWNLPIVIVSSHGERDLVKELASYKILAYLLKPLSADYVVKIISVVFPQFKKKQE